ncbi:MAG: hypothetical protein A2W68_14865 [Betaproteobacteria bacterium RIFCSPLOWO2_02_64_14]|nr:MAG: hypothetical protein A2W68_14865 [Betaproteobacteria bacterium RIFCSPLOWO2_02_64_14]
MRITVPMYEKGRSFIMASGLVKAYGGHRFVYLHLLCQGFENIGKAILLARDYDKYGPELRGRFRHNLEALLSELNVIHGGDFLSKNASTELRELNKFYKQHQLRYGDPVDFSTDVTTLQSDQMHTELVGHLDVLNQKFSAK